MWEDFTGMWEDETLNMTVLCIFDTFGCLIWNSISNFEQNGREGILINCLQLNTCLERILMGSGHIYVVYVLFPKNVGVKLFKKKIGIQCYLKTVLATSSACPSQLSNIISRFFFLQKTMKIYWFQKYFDWHCCVFRKNCSIFWLFPLV